MWLTGGGVDLAKSKAGRGMSTLNLQGLGTRGSAALPRRTAPLVGTRVLCTYVCTVHWASMYSTYIRFFSIDTSVDPILALWVGILLAGAKKRMPWMVLYL